MYSIPKIDEKRDNKSHVNEGGQHLLQSVGQDRHFKRPLCPSLSLSFSLSLSLSLSLSPLWVFPQWCPSPVSSLRSGRRATGVGSTRRCSTAPVLVLGESA